MPKALRLTKAQVYLLRQIDRHGFVVVKPKSYMVGPTRFGRANGDRLFNEGLIEDTAASPYRRIVSKSGKDFLAKLQDA